MTFDAFALHSCRPVSPNLRVIIADGTTLPIASCGTLHTAHFHIPDVAHIPKLSMNLISISQLASHGYLIIFYELLCYVQDHHTRTLIGAGCCLNRGYVLDHLRLPLPAFSVTFPVCLPSIGFMQWHHRLGHPSRSWLSYLIRQGVLGRVSVDRTHVRTVSLKNSYNSLIVLASPDLLLLLI